MTWRRWKRGLLVAALSGGLSGIIGLAIGITWQQAGILLAVSIGKNALMFITSNPVDKLSPDTTPPFKLPFLFLLLAALTLTGCARYHSHQDELATDGTRRQTRVSIWTFWDAHNEVAKLRTTSTDKSQGISLGSIAENTSGTNATALLHDVAEILKKVP